MGSLDAAMAGEALTRKAYVMSGRSYIEKDTDAGKCKWRFSFYFLPQHTCDFIFVLNSMVFSTAKRHEIYDEFEQYKKWKNENDRFDMNEIVLELINKLKQTVHEEHGDSGGWLQLFNAAYLDEIQDFSYAAIFLICNIAGCSSLRWIFAGDTAQMISPG